jgi:two-component system cell cycle sensor histidine kinase/response regulator CckA
MTAAKRILVVDDEPGIQQSLAMLLGFDGHQVQVAGSGEEALEKFQPGIFDLVMTDFSMAGMKGDELASAIKKLEPKIPVLLLTAFPPPVKPPAVDLLMTKPFYVASLREAIAKLCPV